MEGQTDRHLGEPFGGAGYNNRAPILCYFGHNNNNYDGSDSDRDSNYDNDNGNSNDDDDNDNDNGNGNDADADAEAGNDADAAAAAAAADDDDDDYNDNNNNKLWTQFRSHWYIRSGAPVRKHPIWAKMNDCFSRVTSKSDRWPWKTIGHFFSATSSFLHHLIAISEFKLELQSRLAQFGSKSTIFLAVWPWKLSNDLGKQ